MIKVLLFAELSEQANASELELDVVGQTIAQLKEILAHDFPNMSISNGTMIAVNEEYALDEQVINKGDVIALIPPVSGG
ncbi:molybdopterin converting factor subunit 1 [Alkalihalobacillus pseudalcaliphilus]|uniref:molybdopterin converting factor subunit 1 n=1 Tax=Alkalihalobacillus pseudalcaliphilus TaxID=79884 RepID=UPI00064D815F|nr:molybdopterin converting factor subunit 1 [Alkalihalobacillus pseudalcaliphilus]KMK74684.1 molybdenum cofactor biosynthesis protein MoaD [Alkalihalobacillus pseudalcaliphilus]